MYARRQLNDIFKVWTGRKVSVPNSICRNNIFYKWRWSEGFIQVKAKRTNCQHICATKNTKIVLEGIRYMKK